MKRHALVIGINESRMSGGQGTFFGRRVTCRSVTSCCECFHANSYFQVLVRTRERVRHSAATLRVELNSMSGQTTDNFEFADTDPYVWSRL